MDRIFQVAGFKSYLLVALGGSLGCALRWYFSRSFLQSASAFPKSTLLANVLASFVLGLSLGYLERLQGGSGSAPLYLFAAVGFAGGLSTFSTFALELVNLMSAGSFGAASLSLVLNVGLSVISVLAGRFLLQMGNSGAGVG